MKKISLLSALVIGLSSLAQAELDIPRAAFRMSQLEEAKAKATEEEKPLVFVYTNPGST